MLFPLLGHKHNCSELLAFALRISLHCLTTWSGAWAWLTTVEKNMTAMIAEMQKQSVVLLATTHCHIWGNNAQSPLQFPIQTQSPVAAALQRCYVWKDTAIKVKRFIPVKVLCSFCTPPQTFLSFTSERQAASSLSSCWTRGLGPILICLIGTRNLESSQA